MSLARINSLLLNNCETAYKRIIPSSDKLTHFKEHFNSLPQRFRMFGTRAALPETKTYMMQHRMQIVESDMRNIACSLEKQELECLHLKNQLRTCIA